MSFGRGHKDLDGLTGSFALEEEQRRAEAEAASKRPLSTPDADEAAGGDSSHGPRGILERIRHALGR